ncbi:MAG: PD-(D/E)XK nuclease family protein [Myxococcota bacterium]
MSGWFDWLDDRIGALRAGRRVLVLCRTRTTLSLVRRWAARRGGILGLEAATPNGLSQQVRQEPLLALGVVRGGPGSPRVGDVVPRTTAIGRRIDGRPGLSGSAQRWVQHARWLRVAGVAADVPGWLEELVDTGWGHDDEEDALLALITAARARGRKLTASATWDRVVAVGFDRVPTVLAPWESVVVRALTGKPPVPIPFTAGTLPAIAVPDVVAEVRLAVSLAARDPDGTLILVTDTATARRVRDALARSRIPCAWRDTEVLAVHELASAVRRCAPWFADAPDPPIAAGDLAFVLARISLRRLHPAAAAALRALLGPVGLDPDAIPLRRRSVIEVLERTRLLDGPLSGWIARLVALIAELASTEPRIAVAAAEVVVRLELLRASLEARPFDEVLAETVGAPLAFDADDFEDALATLLGDAIATVAAPPGNTLGAVKRYLVASRIRVHDDPVACAILGALRDRADWPAQPSHVHHALSGAHDPGRLSDGVDVVAVDDWDGRPCRRLIVLDVHDHGLARRTAPDPLLTDDQILGLAACSGRALVEERLAQVHRAAAVAGEIVAIVTRRDAGGREVVPPIQLDLRFSDPADGAEGRSSYGFGIPVPEHAELVLEPVTGFDVRDAPAPPEDPDPVVVHLAVQATAEWYREGRGPIPPMPEPRTNAAIGRASSPPATLADQRDRERPYAPAFVLPYFGHAEGVAEAALPSGRAQSVSRLLRPLAHCAYQAFARAILDVRDPVQLDEDLDPREIGTAVHKALETAGPDVRWRGDRDRPVDLDALVTKLRDATDRAFGEALRELGALSEARRASADGQRERWNAHWPAYVQSRTMSPGASDQVIDHHPLLPLAVDLFRRAVPAGARLPDRAIRGWLAWAAKMPPADWVRTAPDVLLRSGERDALPSACLPDLPGLATHREILGLHQAIVDTQRRAEAWRIVPHTSFAEVPFGDAEALGGAPTEPGAPPPALDLGRVVLKLGAEEIELVGRIDRLDLVSVRGEQLAVVVDYKTGTRMDGWKFRKEQSTLRDPQLLVYAMAVERTGRGEPGPLAIRGHRAAIVAHDRIKQTVADPEAAGQRTIAPDTWMPVDPALLAWAARQLGSLLDDARAGRWTLRPRPDTCPMLQSYGHDGCPIARACRFRGLPAAPVVAAEAAAERGEEPA